MMSVMATFVVRPNGILQYDLFIGGQRFREGTGLADTPANRLQIRRNIKRINAELETGVFSYANWFPNSQKIEAAERLLRENRSNDPGQRFGRYAWSWYEMCKGDWKPAYRKRVAHNLRGHIVPFLGDYPVDHWKPPAQTAGGNSPTAASPTSWRIYRPFSGSPSAS
jgi:integrase